MALREVSTFLNNEQYEIRSRTRSSLFAKCKSRPSDINRQSVRCGQARVQQIFNMATEYCLDGGSVHMALVGLSNYLCLRDYRVCFDVLLECDYEGYGKNYSGCECESFSMGTYDLAVRGSNPFRTCCAQRASVTRLSGPARSRVFVSVFPEREERMETTVHMDLIDQAAHVGRTIAECINQRSRIKVHPVDSTASSYLAYSDALVLVEGRVTKHFGPTLDTLSRLQDAVVRRRIPTKTLRRIGEAADREANSNIILIGKTGTGKSTLGNMLRNVFHGINPDVLLPNPFGISASGSCTSSIRRHRIGEPYNLWLWDTPGLGDEYGRDDLFLRKLRDAIEREGTMSAVVMCTYSCARFDSEEQRLLAKYMELLPTDEHHRIFLVACQVANMPNCEGSNEARVSDLIRKRVGVDIPAHNIFNVNVHYDRDCAHIHRLSEALIAKCRLPPFKVGALRRLQALLSYVDDSDKEGRKETKSRLISDSNTRVRKRLEHLSNGANRFSIESSSDREIRVCARSHNLPIGGVHQEILFKLPKAQDIPAKIDRYIRTSRADRSATIDRLIYEFAHHGYLLLEPEDLAPRESRRRVLGGRRSVLSFELVDMKKELDKELRDRILDVLCGDGNEDTNTTTNTTPP